VTMNHLRATRVEMLSRYNGGRRVEELSAVVAALVIREVAYC
jgi:hypothetical protein